MDPDTASQFVSSLVRCIQTFCHGYVQFSSSIEIVGHIYLNVDKGSRFNYIVNEEVSKNPKNHSTVYHTNSYHSLPPARDMLLKMDSDNEHQVEFIPSNQGIKNTESFTDAAASTLPNVDTDVAFPVRLIKNDACVSDRIEVHSQNLPWDEYISQKLPHLPSTSARLLKVINHIQFPQKQETNCSTLNQSIVIKNEPEALLNKCRERITSNGKKHIVEEESLMSDKPCGDDCRAANDPHPSTTQTKHEGADLQADSDSVLCETANTCPTKSLPVHIRQQIVAYANIVGNRPAARHFGVHESSIRHWRKKFGMAFHDNGGRRGRKRKGDNMQDLNSEEIQTSKLNSEHID